ncbi:MAG: nicotinamidase [Acidobacteriota bacterium]
MSGEPSSAELPLPPFFRAENCRSWRHEADASRLLDHSGTWAATHGVEPATSDRSKNHLLIIDAQRDFCLAEGGLFVGGRSGTGALEDTERLARFVYRNLGRLTEITCTLDTHLPFQIFFPSFWLDVDGEHPAENTVVTSEQIRGGEFRPNPAVAGWLCNDNVPWLKRQVEDYCRRLEEAGRYELYLWPPHCLLGSSGHSLVGAIQEARLFHAFCRGAKNFVEVKGGNILTENYSALAPEVLERHDGKVLGSRNEALLDSLLAADRILVAGQAASHCVRATVEDLLQGMAERGADPGKLYLLEDCMSPVAVPDGAGGFLADFTDDSTAALKRFAATGAHVVRSTLPMSRWPG